MIAAGPIVELHKVVSAAPDSQNPNTELLERCINAATDAIERYCQRHFYTKAYDALHHGALAVSQPSSAYSRSRLFLANPATVFATLPITAVSSVTEDGVALNAMLVAPGTPFTNGEGVIVNKMNGTATRVSVASAVPSIKAWTSKHWNVRFQYTAGYDEDTMPADIVEAAVELAWLFYREGTRSGMDEYNLPEGSAQFARLLQPNTKRSLDSYRFERRIVTVAD